MRVSAVVPVFRLDLTLLFPPTISKVVVRLSLGYSADCCVCICHIFLLPPVLDKILFKSMSHSVGS